MSRSRILAEIQNAKHCVLATHFQPDGDALGSVLALGEGIRAMGIPCTVLSPGEAPANLQFMPLLPSMQNEMPEDADVFIALDAAEAARVAPDPAFIQKAKRTICIDHHRSNTGYMDLNWIDPDAGSTSEMVYALLADTKNPLTAAQAAWLYVGLVTDTGRFLYSGTSASSHTMAAALFDCGIDRDEIHRRLFQSQPKRDFELYRQCLERAVFYRNDQLALSWITLSDLKKTGASSDQTDPALHALRDIEEVEMSVLLKEQEDAQFKVSLRSKRFVDVSAIAAHLGGGGHLRAAGCTVTGDLETVRAKVLAATDAVWKAQ